MHLMKETKAKASHLCFKFKNLSHLYCILEVWFGTVGVRILLYPFK